MKPSLKIIKLIINVIACIFTAIVPVPLMTIIWSVISILDWALNGEKIEKDEFFQILEPLKRCIYRIKTVWNE